MTNLLQETSLEEVESQIKELQSKVNELKSDSLLTTCRAIINEASQREDALFKEFQEKIKRVRSEKSEAQNKINGFNSEIESLEDALQLLIDQQEDLLKARAAQEKLNEIKESLKEISEGTVWGEKLRPYQWDDLIHMVTAFKAGRNGVVNANDMSLGKTAETAAMLQILDHLFYEENGRLPLTLWLTKKTLVGSNFRELQKWTPDRKFIKLVKIPDATQRELMVKMAIQANATVVTNYDALNTTPLLKATKWDIIVMDEVHKVKGGANPGKPTAIFTNTKEVCQNARFVMPLTGTPIVNHPREMWCYLHIFDPDKFPNTRTFEREFCFGYGEIQVNWDALINYALKDRVIRRTKKEAGLQLPDKIREIRYLEMEGQQLVHYQNLREQFFTWLDANQEKALTATSILAQLTRLRQCSIIPSSISVDGIQLDCTESVKLDETMDIIEQLVAADEQFVVFSSQFNEPLFELSRRIKQSYPVLPFDIITGSNSADLDKYEQAFQKGETKALLINMKTGSEGLNLHKSPDDWVGGASHAIFLDLWWNPALNTQAEDRLHRPGATDTVECHILRCEDSVDLFIAGILEEKDAMINGIMERDELRTNHDWKSMLEGLI